MKGFLVGLIVAILAAFGVYYVWFMEAARQETYTETTNGVKVESRVPAGVIMEDGTLPE